MSTIERTGIEFEARRIAAAFGVEEWEMGREIGCYVHRKEEHTIEVMFSGTTEVLWIEIDDSDNSCLLSRGGRWRILVSQNLALNELMARGLYKLAFEDAGVLAQLPSLSAHERLELRMTMPREYWPQKWLEEVKG